MSFNYRMDSDEFKNVSEEEIHLSEQNDEEADNFEFNSFDKTMIIKQFKGILHLQCTCILYHCL